MENSLATKFPFDRGARIIAKLESCNYCASPLVQDGLEITCQVEIEIASTLKNKHLINIYTNYVDLSY